MAAGLGPRRHGGLHSGARRLQRRCLGSSDEGGGTTLNFLVDNSEGSTKPAQALAAAFHAKNPESPSRCSSALAAARATTSSRRSSPLAR